MNEVVEMKYNSLEKKKDIKRGVQDGIPIALGYLSVSFAFGIMAVSAGCMAGDTYLGCQCDISGTVCGC